MFGDVHFLVEAAVCETADQDLAVQRLWLLGQLTTLQGKFAVERVKVERLA